MEFYIPLFLRGMKGVEPFLSKVTPLYAIAKTKKGTNYKGNVSALPTELYIPKDVAGFEPATSQLTVEVTLIYTTFKDQVL